MTGTNKSMQEAFQKAKQIFNALAASGNPIAKNDLQHSILCGVDKAYDIS